MPSERADGESVCFPDQLVGAVVLVRDGSRPPGDGANIPIVVVGEFVGGVAAVLYTGSRAGGRLACQLSREPSP